MKAEIDKTGALTVTAEAPVEQFALRIYWERWGTDKAGALRMIWESEKQETAKPESEKHE